MNVVGDRFERRLVEETSKLRVEMAQGFGALRGEIASLRQDMTALASTLRQEMAAGTGTIRQEMAAATSTIRQEMAAATSGLRQEIANQKLEMLKWAFLFWVGQFFAIASLMFLLIRILRPA